MTMKITVLLKLFLVKNVIKKRLAGFLSKILQGGKNETRLGTIPTEKLIIYVLINRK